MAVIDDWLSIISIPAVHCNTMVMVMLITYYLCLYLHSTHLQPCFSELMYPSILLSPVSWFPVRYLNKKKITIENITDHDKDTNVLCDEATQ